jgi:hypothetical protein
MMNQLQCENCGGALEVANQFVRSVTCRFCGSAYIVSGDSTLSANGQGTSLANYPSRVSVGSRGKMKGRGFQVLGRIRYTYDEGFWDEWQIMWDDDAPPSWLEEDEGYWTLFDKMRLRETITSYDSIRVGASVTINGMQVFITERRTSRVMGSEGQFSAVMPIQGQFGYATGNAGEQIVSVNFWEDEIEVSRGQEVALTELVLG